MPYGNALARELLAVSPQPCQPNQDAVDDSEPKVPRSIPAHNPTTRQ
jgi:hypothetical protein